MKEKRSVHALCGPHWYLFPWKQTAEIEKSKGQDYNFHKGSEAS